jgi:hypothetical protein
MCRQVLRYTLYNKERSSFVDASFLHNDWWQKVRDLFHPPSEEEAEEEEEECTDGDPDCEDEEEVRPALLSTPLLIAWESSPGCWHQGRA